LPESLIERRNKKIDLRDKIMIKEEQFQLIFFCYQTKKVALCVNGEYAQWLKKVVKLLISGLIKMKMRKNLRSFISTLNGLD
jgi:hypothetical protein